MIRTLRPLVPLMLVTLAAGCAGPRLARPELFGPGLDDAAALQRAEAEARGGAAEARARAGWVAVMRGEGSRPAEAHWEAAVARNPRVPLAWLGLGEARAARRDTAGAVDAWLRILEESPDHPLAELAARRLARFTVTRILPERVPRLEAALADPKVHPGARPWVAEALAFALEHQGAGEQAARLWGAGSPAAWTVVGPWSRTRALAQDEVFPPEATGTVAARSEGPLGRLEARAVPTRKGRLDLDGEPRWGDVYYALADLEVPESGRYRLGWHGVADLRLRIDGTEVLVRNELRGPAPRGGVVSVSLSRGTHRVVARIIRGGGAVDLGVTLLDRQGRATGRWAPAPPDSPPPTGSASREAAVPGFPGWIAEQLAAAPDDALAAWLDALYHLRLDDDRTRDRLATVFAAAPRFPWARALEADLEAFDPAVPAGLRTARAARALGRAAADPQEARAREELTGLALEQGRWDAAERQLSELEALAPDASETARLRARLLEARGSLELARRHLEGFVARLGPEGVSCRVLEDLYRLRRDLGAVAAADAAAAEGARCGLGGRARLADHRADRGAPEAAVPLLEAVRTLDPGDLDTGLRLAELQTHAGDPDAARATLEALARTWPRSAEVAGRLGALAARAGDDGAARRWRERQLALDPGHLSLRRSLARQAGRPLLDEAGVDLEAAIRAYEREADGFGAGADAVMVVDHAAARVFAEDPARPVVVERIQSVWQVRTKDGIDAQGEVQLPGDAEVLALHVRKPDGRRLEPEEVGLEGRITLRGLEVGDYVVTDYLLAGDARDETLPGWRAGPFYFQVAGVPVWRSSYEVRAPASVGLEVEAHGLRAAPPRREGDALVFRHTAERIPALQPEPDTPDPEEFVPWVRVGAGAGPEGYAVAWGDYVADRALPTWEVRRWADTVLAGMPAGDREDPGRVALALAGAVDRAVRGDRPSSRLTDRGAHALLRGRGNRLLATRAALAAVGIDSHVVLVRSFRAPPPAGRRFPAGDLYTHAVLQVPLPDGGSLWLDQNRRTAPLTHLRALHGGQPGLRLAEPGRPGGVVTPPAPPPGADRKETRIRLALSADGALRAQGEERYLGHVAAVVRGALGDVPATRRRQALESTLTEALGPLAVESLTFEGEALDVGPGVPFVIGFEVRVPDWARSEAGRLVLPGQGLFPTHLSRRLIQQARRETPLLLDSDHREVLRATFTLPPGARLEGPGTAPITLEGPFGRYARRVTVTGDEVVLEEVLDLALIRVAPEDYPALARFAAQVDAAQARSLVVVLSPEGSGEGAAVPPGAGDPTPRG